MNLAWQKSSFSAGAEGDACVELAATPNELAFRESDEPRVVLTTNRDRLGALLTLIKLHDLARELA